MIWFWLFIVIMYIVSFIIAVKKYDIFGGIPYLTQFKEFLLFVIFPFIMWPFLIIYVLVEKYKNK